MSPRQDKGKAGKTPKNQVEAARSSLAKELIRLSDGPSTASDQDRIREINALLEGDDANLMDIDTESAAEDGDDKTLSTAEIAASAVFASNATADKGSPDVDNTNNSSGSANAPPTAEAAKAGSGTTTGSNPPPIVTDRTDESTPDRRQRRQAEGSNNQSSEPSVKSEPDDDTSPLFVGQSDSTFDLENDPEEPLFASPSHSLGKDVRTVAWNSQSGTYINGYGKKGCSRYRLDGNCTAGYKKDDSEDFYKNSLGDKQEHRKWKYTKDHFSGQIWGVAWEGDGSENDLDLIDPDQAGRRKGKDGNGTGAAWPRTYVLVLWDINNQKSKRWETRSTVRRLWGNKKADKAIFEAACQAEERYIAATQGKRGYTRLPSAALRRRTKSPSPSRSRSRSTSSTPARTSRRSASNDKAVSEETLEDFKTDYFELAGVEAFAELSMEDKMECMKMWKVKKSGLRSGL